MDKSQTIKLLVCVAVLLTLWNIPASFLGMPDLTMIEQRVIALFAFTALMWILETIPIWTTSVFAMVAMLLTVSNNSLVFFKAGDISPEVYGTAISYKAIMASFADPIIMLFLGGFALAMAATKVGLDINLARVLLKPFGTKSETVVLGFMIVTAVFSMFMSNTATAAMMLAIVAPVLRSLPADGKGKIALALSIPVGANVGGIGTPIGTPPNMIALKYMEESDLGSIGFGQWMLIMVPFVIVVLAFAWFLLIKMYPFKQKNIEITIHGAFKKDTKSIIVYITFAITVLLWMLDDKTGMNANIVALIPLAVFCATGVIDKNDLKSISWDVLWLVAGGFALGVGLDKSGLAKHIVEAIPFDTWSPIMVFIGSGLVCYLMATFMSHTATANLLMPILGALAVGMKDAIEPYGGAVTMLVGVAVASSLAMAMPISTPPNALAHATGVTEQKDLAKIGIPVGVLGIALGYILMIALGSTGFFK